MTTTTARNKVGVETLKRTDDRVVGTDSRLVGVGRDACRAIFRDVTLIPHTLEGPPFLHTGLLLNFFPATHNTDSDVDYLSVARMHSRHTDSSSRATTDCGDMAVQIKVRPARDDALDKLSLTVQRQGVPGLSCHPPWIL